MEIIMCNNCQCSEMDKCSVRGYAPIGWCCERCEKKDLRKKSKIQFFEN